MRPGNKCGAFTSWCKPRSKIVVQSSWAQCSEFLVPKQVKEYRDPKRTFGSYPNWRTIPLQSLLAGEIIFQSFGQLLASVDLLTSLQPPRHFLRYNKALQTVFLHAACMSTKKKSKMLHFRFGCSVNHTISKYLSPIAYRLSIPYPS